MKLLREGQGGEEGVAGGISPDPGVNVKKLPGEEVKMNRRVGRGNQ